MKKFIVVESGKEIKIGDTITLVYEFSTPFGIAKVDKTIPLTEPVLIKLIADKKVKVVDTESNIEHIDIWNAALNNLSKKTGWKLKKLNNILSIIDSVNPWAVSQIILMEIAIELDKKYKNHISKSKEIYSVSPQDGGIHKIDKKTVTAKDYKAFPIFRNEEDAKIASTLIKKKNFMSTIANA